MVTIKRIATATAVAGVVAASGAGCGLSSTSGSGSSSSGHSAPAAPTHSSAPATPQTVTYEVTGTPGASVTYGPSGSSLNGSVPMNISKPLATPSYYAIQAQLQGSGSVSCVIKVDGKTVSSGTANGGYNIAMCEISQDPVSGKWVDDNSG